MPLKVVAVLTIERDGVPVEVHWDAERYPKDAHGKPLPFDLSPIEEVEAEDQLDIERWWDGYVRDPD